MRILLLGYTSAAASIMDIIARTGNEIAALVLPSNRKGSEVDAAIESSKERKIEFLFQPPNPPTEDFIEKLESFKPDLGLVFSYSQLVPKQIRDTARLGFINIHGALLPRNRGQNALNWVIINGEVETGVTIHYMGEGIDTGDIIAQKKVEIEFKDTALTLREKLNQASFELLEETLPLIGSGKTKSFPQDEALATTVRKRSPMDGLIDWNKKSVEIYNLVRALVKPWPGAFGFLKGEKIIVWKTSPVEGNFTGSPGSILRRDESTILIKTGDGAILVEDFEKLEPETQSIVEGKVK